MRFHRPGRSPRRWRPKLIRRSIEFILADRDRYVAMSLAARKAHEEKYNYETVFQPVLERILAITEPASTRG